MPQTHGLVNANQNLKTPKINAKLHRRKARTTAHCSASLPPWLPEREGESKRLHPPIHPNASIEHALWKPSTGSVWRLKPTGNLHFSNFVTCIKNSEGDSVLRQTHRNRTRKSANHSGGGRGPYTMDTAPPSSCTNIPLVNKFASGSASVSECCCRDPVGRAWHEAPMRRLVAERGYVTLQLVRFLANLFQ